MNYYADKQLVSEAITPNGVGYILSEDNMLDQTKLMVMNDPNKDYFVQGARSRYNGNTKITYFVSGFSPLSEQIERMTPDNFVSVTASIFKTITEIIGTGFFKYPDIDASINKIFVDTSNLSVHMVCLPINYKYAAGSDGLSVMRALRSDLLRIMSERPRLRDSADIIRLKAIVANGELSAKDIYRDICRMSPMPQPQMRTMPVLRCVNDSVPDIRVTKTPFVIGRSQVNADGFVGADKMAVGRRHCEIINNGGDFCVVDKESKCGTRLNGVPLCPLRPYPLSNGDSLMIANLLFKVSM